MRERKRGFFFHLIFFFFSFPCTFFFLFFFSLAHAFFSLVFFEPKKFTKSPISRAHAVDAAIVRIMKTRRSLAHKLLARELATQLRFAVSGPALKKRVESLIDREFLARDEADPSVYNYLA